MVSIDFHNAPWLDVDGRKKAGGFIPGNVNYIIINYCLVNQSMIFYSKILEIFLKFISAIFGPLVFFLHLLCLMENQTPALVSTISTMPGILIQLTVE